MRPRLRTSRRAPSLAALAALLLGAACDRHAPSSSAPAASLSAPVSAPAVSSPAPPPSAAAPAPPLAHCKALATKKPTGFNAPRGTYIGMIPAGDNLYYLAWKEGPAKAVLSRVPRSGEPAVELATQEGLGRPESFTIDAAYAYYTRRGALYRAPVDGSGAIVKLAADFSTPIALDGDAVVGVRCDPKAKTDELVRIPRAGGDVVSVAHWERKQTGASCEYKSLAVDAGEAFVGDWTTRRLLAVPLTGGAVRELATGQAFLGRILPERANLVFQASNGLFRVPRAGGAPTQLTEVASMPFGELAWDETRFFVFQARPYERQNFTLSLPREGGATTVLETFVAEDVTMGPGILGLAVDDECIYLARGPRDVVTILARRKP